jgi:hypothetical protein
MGTLDKHGEEDGLEMTGADFTYIVGESGGDGIPDGIESRFDPEKSSLGRVAMGRITDHEQDHNEFGHTC